VTDEQKWLVSVDDHVLEPPHVWEERLPKRFRTEAPKISVEGRREFWEFQGKRIETVGLSAVAGKANEDFSPEPVTYRDMRAGCYDSVARLEDMNRAGILASLCFPSFPRFCGQTFYETPDRDLGFACVQAYNDWMLEEWCGSAPGRYIPLILIPLWDPALAAAEIERCAGLGARAFAFSEEPSALGLPTVNDPGRYWDPVMAAAAETQTVVCMHIGSSSRRPKICPDSSYLADLSWGASLTAGAMLTWLFSGYFDRMPNLRVAFSEGNIGWIPYFLERAQQVVDTQRGWIQRGVEVDEGSMFWPLPPATIESLDMQRLYRDHVYGCFIDDAHGMRNLDVIGEDNVMIETDYPHSDSTWPNCIEVARNAVKELSSEVQYKVMRGNAERLFRFTPIEPN
jgi:predicted TIM-barrel fold metal-dependent hydrolase